MQPLPIANRERAARKSGSPLLICYETSLGAARAIEVAGTLFPGQPAIVLYACPGIDWNRVHTTSVPFSGRS